MSTTAIRIELKKILNSSYYYDTSRKIKVSVNKIKKILEILDENDEKMDKMMRNLDSFINKIEDNNDKICQVTNSVITDASITPTVPLR